MKSSATVNSATTGDRVDALRRVGLLSSLGDREIRRLAGDMKERQVEAGREVVTQGSGGIAFFVVLDGTAKVLVDGQERATLRAGDSFGEAALFLSDARRTATVVAETDLRLGCLTTWEFKPFVEGNAQVAWALLQTMAKRLSERALH